MKKFRKREIDLLINRREASNTKKITYSYIKNLRIRGLFFGGIITFLTLLGCIYLGYETYSKIKYRKEITPQASKYAELKKTYKNLTDNIRSITATNIKISQGIIGVKSGSALLLELNQILPKTIQVKSIKSQNNNLILEGLAYQPKALDSINSLQLQLSNSFLINDNSPFLIKAKESNSNEKSYLKFTISSQFNRQSLKVLLANYERLGSNGLAKRVKLLEQEGLIK